VIHRDFKPANVMIDREGIVRVLDFGLARRDALDSMPGPPSDSGKGPRTSTVGGTRGYMAPEQYEGRVDERSDQFSFCASLFLALYGRLPHDPGTGAPSPAELVRQAIERSSGGHGVPTWLRRAVLRGLRPELAERHLDMSALLAALRPHRPTRWWWVGAAGLVAVVGATWWSWRQYDRCIDDGSIAALWSESRRQQLERAGTTIDVSAIDASMHEFVEAWATLRAQTCRAHVAGTLDDELHELHMTCLQHARSRVEYLLERAEDPAFTNWRLLGSAIVDGVELTECRDEARLRARRPIDRIDPALSEAITDALAKAIAHSLLGEHEAYLAALLEIERTLADDARAPAETLWLAIHIGGALAESDRLVEAEARLRAALQAAQRWHRWPEIEGGLMFGLAEVLSRLPQRSTEARILAEQAVAILESSPIARDHLPHALQVLALAQHVDGDPERALETIDRALASGSPPTYPGQRHRSEQLWRGASLNIRGQVLEALHDPGDAEIAYREGLVACGELGGPSLLEATLLNNLGVLLRSQGRSEEALALQQRAVEAKSVLGRYDLAAESMTNMGNIHLSAERYPAALATYDEALELLAASGGEHGAKESLIRLNRALALYAAGRPDEAIEDYGRALALALATSPPNVDLAYSARIGRATARLGRGDPSAARADFEEASIHEPRAADPYDRAELRFGLAQTLPPELRRRSLELAAEAEHLAREAGDPALAAMIAEWRAEQARPR
jgi:tetratricopeptide (TPR) repeat protein